MTVEPTPLTADEMEAVRDFYQRRTTNRLTIGGPSVLIPRLLATLDTVSDLAADAVLGAATVGMYFPALELALGMQDGLTRSIAETTARALVRGGGAE